MEYLGGLIPLLSARKSSKLKPDFVIFDPYLSRNKKAKSSKNPPKKQFKSLITETSDIKSSLEIQQLEKENKTQDEEFEDLGKLLN